MALTQSAPDIQIGPDVSAPGSAPEITHMLALLGVSPLQPDLLCPDVTWERSGKSAAVGRDAVCAIFTDLDAPETTRPDPPPNALCIDQFVSQGRTATLSGHLTRDGHGAFLFCHILQYETPAHQRLARIISFEHRLR